MSEQIPLPEPVPRREAEQEAQKEVESPKECIFVTFYPWERNLGRCAAGHAASYTSEGDYEGKFVFAGLSADRFKTVLRAARSGNYDNDCNFNPAEVEEGDIVPFMGSDFAYMTPHGWYAVDTAEERTPKELTGRAPARVEGDNQDDERRRQEVEDCISQLNLLQSSIDN